MLFRATFGLDLYPVHPDTLHLYGFLPSAVHQYHSFVVDRYVDLMPVIRPTV